MSGGLTMAELRKFMNPRVVVLILSICAADAVYMLSLYQVANDVYVCIHVDIYIVLCSSAADAVYMLTLYLGK
jgi:hypothetical protein